jgi:Protein of unknown function (DUF5131)
MRQVGMAATAIIGRTPHGIWRVDMTSWTPEGGLDDRVWMPPWPLPNAWMGTSIESDDYAWRADELRRPPAAIRFLSLEPLLGPLPSLDLTGIDWVIVGGESGPGFGTWTWARCGTCGTAVQIAGSRLPVSCAFAAVLVEASLMRPLAAPAWPSMQLA